MKNFKKVVFSMLAMLVMVTGAKAAEFDITKCTEAKDGKLPSNVCTLNAAVTVSGDATIDKDVTIVTTKTNTLTFSGKLIIARGNKVTIDCGVILGNGLELAENSYLKVTNAKDEKLEVGADGKVLSSCGRTAIALSGAGEHEIVVNHATLDVSGNDKGFVNYDSAKLKITLNTATLKINDNNLNAMNGGEVVAEASNIEVKNNGMGGFNAKLTAKYGSTLTATGNGFQGVTLAANSNIEPGSKIVATGNLVGNKLETDKREAFKADFTLAGNVTLSGDLVADSISMEKETWGSGNVKTGDLTLSSTSHVDVKESKSFCQANKYNEMTGCSENVEVSYKAATNDYAVVSIGDKDYLYTADGYTKDIALDNNITNLVVTKETDFGTITVAPGTTVINETGRDIYVAIEGSDNAVKVPKAEEGKDPVPTVVGTKTDEPTPGTPGEGQGEPSEGEPSTGDEGNTGSTGDNTTGTNPGTFDGIASFVTLAISSLSAAGYSIKKIVRR